MEISFRRFCTEKNRLHRSLAHPDELCFRIPCQNSRSLFLKVYTGSDPCYRLAYQEENQNMLSLSGKKAPLIPRYYPITFSEPDLCYPAVCMDFVPGQSLRQILSQRKLSSPELYLEPSLHVHLLEQLADLLLFLYENDIFYLDLNPDNILIRNASFDLSLVDFTFCPSKGSRIPESYLRKSCHFIDTGLTDSRLLLQLLAYLHAFILYGGDPEQMGEQISAGQISRLLCHRFPNYDPVLSLIYPAGDDPFSGKPASAQEDRLSQTRFFQQYPSLEHWLPAIRSCFLERV